MSTPSKSDAHDPWGCLLRGHAAVRRSVAAHLQDNHGLTINDYEALLLLSRANGRSMRRVDLAKALQLSASGVTRLLEGLERQGLVARALCEKDGRVTYAVLTEPGQRKLDQASGSHVAAVRAVFEQRYTRAELDTLAQLLARLHVPAAAERKSAA